MATIFRQLDDSSMREMDREPTVYIAPMAYIRSIATIAWNSLRHPFSYFAVDLTTGRLVRRSHLPFAAEDVKE
jgi:hypothetical protein